MKIYEVGYKCPGITCMDDIVVCDKDEDIIGIISERNKEKN